MSEQEAYEAWFRGEQGKPYDGAYTFAEAAWHAALSWLRSQGEPIATLHDDGYWTWKNRANAPHESNYAGWRMDVFAAPQPAIPDGWRLVPVEPTGGMLDAAIAAGWSRVDIYQATIEAAQEPSK